MIPALPRFLRALLLALVAGTGALSAQFGIDQSPVKASLVADVAALSPGASFTVALRLEHTHGWHTYYSNPGQVGSPPAVKWTLPNGFSASDIIFPVPILSSFVGENFYGYEGETWFLSTITSPDILPETIQITAAANWLACKEQCIPGNAELRLDIPSAATTTANAELTADFASAVRQIPLREFPWTISATDAGEHILLDLRPGADAVLELEDVHFFSSDRQDDARKPQKLSPLPDGAWRLEVPRATEDPFGDPIEPLPHLSGILKAGSGWIQGQASPGLLLDQLPVAAAAGPADAGTAAGSDTGLPLLAILGLMFLGGLILNLMPCVFPVIGLKIMGFVQQAGEDRRKVMIHGLIFTAGVLVSFWVISGLLYSARQATGDSVSWGYQLQNPWVVLSLMLVMFVLALSMYGIFEIGAGAAGIGGKLQGSEGVAGSFFSGVLATVVATPCSAPFLGAGIGAAIGLPAVPFFLAFTAMAVGLALPYLVLSAFPQLIEKLPRPGPWMESFKQAMSFLLFATAGFLLWVYVGLIGLPSMLDAVVGLTAIAVAGWIYGRWNTPIRSRRTRVIAIAATAAFAIAGVAALLPPDKDLEWSSWSEQRVDQLLADDTAVFVDFTAQWCLTCQLNKKSAYSKDVVAVMKDRGIVALKADNTEPSPEIARTIRSLGRGAVPVNVLYVPGKDPIVTPELLTPGYLIDLFSNEVPK